VEALSGEGGQIELMNVANTDVVALFDVDSSNNTRVWSLTNNPLTFGTYSSEVARFDTSGNLLVGTTTGGAGKIRALNTANSYAGGGLCTINTVGNYWGVLCASTNDLYFGQNTVDKAYISASTGAYTAVSDMTLKKDIEDISLGLNAINALRPVQYRMLEDAEDAQKHLGFLAQEVEPIIPSSVSVMQGGKFGMDKSEVIPVLVAAIKELSAKNDALEARLAALEAK
jgi:hypothetical protein